MKNYAKLMQTYLKLILPLHYTHENKLSIFFQNFLKLKMVKMKLTFKIFGLNKKQLKIDKY